MAAAGIAGVHAAFFTTVGEDRSLAWGAGGGLVHFTVGGAVVAAVLPALDETTTARHPGSPAGGTGRATSSPSCSGT